MLTSEAFAGRQARRSSNKVTLFCFVAIWTLHCNSSLANATVELGGQFSLNPSEHKNSAHPVAVAPASDGGFIIAGSETNLELANTNSHHARVAWVFDIDRNNKVRWQYKPEMPTGGTNPSVTPDSQAVGAVSMPDGSAWICIEDQNSMQILHFDQSGRIKDKRSLPKSPPGNFPNTGYCFKWHNGIGVLYKADSKPSIYGPFRLAHLKSNGDVDFEVTIPRSLMGRWEDVGKPVELKDGSIIFASWINQNRTLKILRVRTSGQTLLAKGIELPEAERGVISVATDRSAEDFKLYFGPSIASPSVRPRLMRFNESLEEIPSSLAGEHTNFTARVAFDAHEGTLYMIGYALPSLLGFQGFLPQVVVLNRSNQLILSLDLPKEYFDEGGAISEAALSEDGSTLLIARPAGQERPGQSSATQLGVRLFTIKIRNQEKK